MARSDRSTQEFFESLCAPDDLAWIEGFHFRARSLLRLGSYGETVAFDIRNNTDDLERRLCLCLRGLCSLSIIEHRGTEKKNTPKQRHYCQRR